MLNKTEIQARELIIEQIDKLIGKYNKKADKEKAKRDNAYITYQGEKYYSESDLQEAYACDVFTCGTYDRLLERINKARGSVDRNEYTPTEQLILNLDMIRNNFRLELIQDEKEKQQQDEKDKRAVELSSQGYSYKEIETIIGNEELMRYE